VTGRAVRVLASGPLVTVQDAGRTGVAHLGVPRAGWLDPAAATLANRLVGNPDGLAVLEVLLGGLTLEATAAMAVAVSGAPVEVRVDRRPVAHGAAVPVAAGQTVSLGVPPSGLRSYVAFSGGVGVPPVLGSRATDTLSWTGPPPVQEGTVLPIGAAVGEPSSAEALTRPPGPTLLEVTPGPRVDWFTTTALTTLTTSSYTVEPDSDRIALRLSGPSLERAVTGELPSEGLVLGAVQVPPDGQPLVFLADHPTTGGYPVVAVADRDSVARCAQLRPGEELRFRVLPPAPGQQPGPRAALG
jgi:biotin-dependent carboxylase-like uncharacterized protein